MSNTKTKKTVMFVVMIAVLCALLVPVSFAFAAMPMSDEPDTTSIVSESESQPIQTIKQPDGISLMSTGASANKISNGIAIVGENETYKDPDDDDSDDTVEVTINNRKPKLSISKKSDKEGSVSVGDKITYTVKVENTGDADALNVIIKDTFKLIINNQ